jgi:outer membrane immunogenic protein
MRNILPALLVTFGLVAGVHAGSESYSGKEMKQVATQTPPPCPTWTGFYLGLSGGYDRALVDPSLRLGGDYIGFVGTPSTERAGDRDFDIDGAQVGGVIGYNFQFNNFVVGLEGSGSYLWARDSRVDHFVFPQAETLYRMSTSAETDYLATVGPRFGYAFCRFMPYITGGAAFGNLRYAQSITFPGGGPANFQSGRGEEDSVGWFIGGGLEYALSDHWHIRGDYKYVDLGADVDFTSDFVPPAAPAHSHAELREHSATAALVFKF